MQLFVYTIQDTVAYGAVELVRQYGEFGSQRTFDIICYEEQRDGPYKDLYRTHFERIVQAAPWSVTRVGYEAESVSAGTCAGVRTSVCRVHMYMFVCTGMIPFAYSLLCTCRWWGLQREQRGGSARYSYERTRYGYDFSNIHAALP